MNYHIFPAPPMLQKYVRYFWSAENDGSGGMQQEINTIVDDSSGLIIQHHNGHSSFLDENKERIKIALAYGKRTSSTKTMSDMPFSATGANFTSQGIKMILGMDTMELTDTLVGLEDIQAKYVVEKLMDQRDHMGRIRVLTSFITRQAKTAKEEDKLVQHCCATIKAGAFNMRIAHLANTYGISERQLERRFHQAIGLPPKLFMRMMKFQYALKRIAEGKSKNCCDIAYEFGYSDQSRLISDFKEFTNHTPRQLLQNMPKILVLNER
jgi:AraC-like DNA-binding protein